MDTTLNRANLRSRYLFTGALVPDTALHIGGGREASTVTDSPILRDTVGRPLIPGSSFKGAFRAAVERLVPNLGGFRTCQLVEGFPECLSTNRAQREAFGRLSEVAGRGIRLGEDDRKVLKALDRESWIGQEVDESHLLDVLAEQLCDTCKTFGSVHLAAVARFHDLPVIEPWAETTQIRDGVGIDRDSERAMDQIKFDYEIVPAQTAFEFSLTLENPTERDLALVALGLQEFVSGMVPLGGIRSRGLGRCHLDNVQVTAVDFTKSDRLKAYLLGETLKPVPLSRVVAGYIRAALPA